MEFLFNLLKDGLFVTAIYFQCIIIHFEIYTYVPESGMRIESVRSTHSDSRTRYRLTLPLFFLLFFYRPSNWNWVVTSPVGGFSRQIPENPRRDRWPPPEHPASSEAVKGRAANCNGERGRDEREDGERGIERMERCIPHRYSLTQAILSQYRLVYRHHVWSNW